MLYISHCEADTSDYFVCCSPGSRDGGREISWCLVTLITPKNQLVCICRLTNSVYLQNYQPAEGCYTL